MPMSYLFYIYLREAIRTSTMLGLKQFLHAHMGVSLLKRTPLKTVVWLSAATRKEICFQSQTFCSCLLSSNQ